MTYPKMVTRKAFEKGKRLMSENTERVDVSEIKADENDFRTAGAIGFGSVKNKYRDENGITWTKARCFFCQVHCGIYGGVNDDNEVVCIKPLDAQSRVCTRMGKDGENFIKFHNHPNRINHPLKRIGARGEDRWEQISWDQALDEISAKLLALKEEYGPETLVVSEGTYRSDHLWARTRFANLFGNPGNIIDPGTICWCWTHTINMAMTGWPIETTLSIGAAEANTGVLWGVRPYDKQGEFGMWSQVSAILKRKENQGRLIVIDPVCTEEAKHASTWLPIKPGTDLFMMLTWCNYIIQNDLYQKDFLKWWSNGVFLVRTDTGKLLHVSEVEQDGKREDFVVWDNAQEGITTWCSDENRYYAESEVDAQLLGRFEVELLDGSKVECATAFELLKERLQSYTLEACAELTGVEANKIEDAVRTYATNGPAYICWGVGGGDMHGYNASYSGVAKTLLRILTGNIDNFGGEYLGDPGLLDENGEKHFAVRDSEMELSEVVTPEMREKFLGNEQFRLMSWKGFQLTDACYRKMWDIPRQMLHMMLVTPPLAWKAILEGDPYPVKAMIAWSSNPLCWAPNTKQVYKALKELELLVVVDYWKTPTAALADYILPAADSLERPLATTGEDSIDMMMIGDRICQPLYERHMDYNFWRDLGIRCGQENEWPWETYEEVIAHRLERTGMSYEQATELGFWMGSPIEFNKYTKTLANGQTRGFVTPSRKLELFPSVFEDCDYDPLPSYRELPETSISNPELAKEYPMCLTIGGRWFPMYHSEYRLPGYGTRSQWPDPTFLIHAQDARAMGIRDGDWCWIETPRGRIRQRAKLEHGIVRGSVQVQPSWWFPELPAEEPWSQGIFESNGNVLTDDSIESLDPMGGQWVTRGLLCKVYPCIDPRDRSDVVSPVESYIKGDEDEFFHKTFSNLAHVELKK
jgi:anaerobic selenocysteine-containing dehydrogenase